VVAGHPVSCADLDQATQAEARRLLVRGYRPPGLLQALDANSHQQLLCALAGSRIGLVLTRRLSLLWPVQRRQRAHAAQRAGAWGQGAAPG
jgi:hypothetical protein